MAKLKAVRSVLFESTLYSPGASLPTKNPTMVTAWIDAGTAVWEDDSAEPKKVTKAKQATAQAGLAGEAVSSESEVKEDLVGRVPTTSTRSKTKKKSDK